MTFENLCTFFKAFGLYPESITKQNLLLLYQSFLHNNYDERTFDHGSLILLLGVVALQYQDQGEQYSASQKLLILIEKMSIWQSKIDKGICQQMKNHASFSYARPKDFITVFGPHVMLEFPHIKAKIAPDVNCKPTNIVLQRIKREYSPSKGKVPFKSLKDIFYRGDRESEEHEQLRIGRFTGEVVEAAFEDEEDDQRQVDVEPSAHPISINSREQLASSIADCEY